MRQSKFPKDLFFISILTLLTVITWIIIDAYRAVSKNDIPKVLQQQIEPLNPQLDIKILENLSGRIQVGKDALLLPKVTPTIIESQP